jgi:hypothetical protein
MAVSGRAKSQVARTRARRGIWSRLFDALHESRLRQAQREIAFYRNLYSDHAPNSDDTR